MQPHQSEIAKEALDVYAAQLSPVYDALRERFLGSLTTNQYTLDALRHDEADRQHNFALVRDFVAALPSTPDSGSSTVEATDAYTAKQIQANVLWLTIPYTYSDRNGHAEPFYVIGRRPAADPESYEYGRSSATTLLLCSANRQDTKPLRTVTVWDDQLAATEEPARQAAYAEYPPETIRTMFDRKSGNLMVGSRTPGSMRTAVGNSTLFIQPRFKDTAQVVAKKGMAVQTGYSGFGGTMEASTLAEFDVFHHLNRLATAFGQVDALEALLETRAQQVEPHPVDIRYQALANATDAATVSSPDSGDDAGTQPETL